MTGTNTTIRVVVVDDHDMVRRGLAVFLRTFDDLKLVGEAADGEEAVRIVEELRPDVVLMDLRMPVMDGVEATKVIRAQFPETQVIALTSFKDERLVHDALSAGAIGYLLKNASVDDLAAAIRAPRGQAHAFPRGDAGAHQSGAPPHGQPLQPERARA